MFGLFYFIKFKGKCINIVIVFVRVNFKLIIGLYCFLGYVCLFFNEDDIFKLEELFEIILIKMYRRVEIRIILMFVMMFKSLFIRAYWFCN
jgi:hypothetical protein